LDIVANLFDLTDQTRGPIEQHAAGVRQEHAASVTDEKIDPKLVLEEFDVSTESRLSGPKPISRLAETPQFRNGPESTQLFEIHRLP
jgi:hypothetical protein